MLTCIYCILFVGLMSTKKNEVAKKRNMIDIVEFENNKIMHACLINLIFIIRISEKFKTTNLPFNSEET